jgi:hypothetical protein
MTDDRPARSTARTFAGILVLAILLNVLVRVVGLLEIDLPSFETLKNAVILSFLLFVVIGKTREERRRERA